MFNIPKSKVYSSYRNHENWRRWNQTSRKKEYICFPKRKVSNFSFTI